MTLPRRKRRLWASSSLVPAQCQARLSPEILPLLSQEEGCRRQETMVLRLELSPIYAGCTHAITAACRRSRGPPPPTAMRQGRTPPTATEPHGPSRRRRRPPSPRHWGRARLSAAGHSPRGQARPERRTHQGGKPMVHLPWPKSASPCRRSAYHRPHETAVWALTTGGQICAPPTGLASGTKKSPHGMPSARPSRRWVEDAAADDPAWGLHQMQARRGGRGRGRAREENEKTPSLPS